MSLPPVVVMFMHRMLFCDKTFGFVFLTIPTASPTVVLWSIAIQGSKLSNNLTIFLVSFNLRQTFHAVALRLSSMVQLPYARHIPSVMMKNTPA